MIAWSKLLKKKTTFIYEIIIVFDILSICIELYNFYGFDVNLLILQISTKFQVSYYFKYLPI
jgi:hypothetical protein